MLSFYENENFIDPFSLLSPPEKLVSMTTGVESPPEVEKSLLSCHDTGKRLLQSLVSERFIPKMTSQQRKPSLILYQE